MITTAIRTKVHKYIDEADNDVLEVVYKLLEVYRQNNSSLLSDDQKKEVLKRSVAYKTGKTKTYTFAEVKKRIRRKVSGK